jgi:SOS-response transcriptional repressor LexA
MRGKMTNEKYERVQRELKEVGTSKMKCIGRSMEPKVLSHSTVTFEAQEAYEVGDIVFCKVKGKTYVHLILKKDSHKGYLIGNNKGRENGWTNTIWGKAIHVVPPRSFQDK